MLFLVTRFFGVKLYELFPLKLLAKILIPSALVLMLERYVFVNLVSWNEWAVLLVSFGVYAILYFAYSLVAKMNYIGIIKPLLSKK